MCLIIQINVMIIIITHPKFMKLLFSYRNKKLDTVSWIRRLYSEEDHKSFYYSFLFITTFFIIFFTLYILCLGYRDFDDIILSPVSCCKFTALFFYIYIPIDLSIRLRNLFGKELYQVFGKITIAPAPWLKYAEVKVAPSIKQVL